MKDQDNKIITTIQGTLNDIEHEIERKRNELSIVLTYEANELERISKKVKSKNYEVADIMHSAGIEQSNLIIKIIKELEIRKQLTESILLESKLA